jgi:hypothetical protein
VRDAAGEPLDRLRVVGSPFDRLGEQGQRADRRLQLVPQVGHEVATDRFDPPGLGHVLQHQGDRPGRRERAAVQPDAVHAHQTGADTGQVPRETDVDPASPAGAYLAHQAEQLRHHQAAAPHDAQRAGGRIGEQHRVVGVDEHHGGIHEVQQPPGQGRLGQREDVAAGPRLAGVGARTEDDGGGHHATEDEADHQGDQGTHEPMLGRRSARTGPCAGFDRSEGSGVHLWVGRRSSGTHGSGHPAS